FYEIIRIKEVSSDSNKSGNSNIIKEIFKYEGDQVKKGDLLAKADIRILEKIITDAKENLDLKIKALAMKEEIEVKAKANYQKKKMLAAKKVIDMHEVRNSYTQLIDFQLAIISAKNEIKGDTLNLDKLQQKLLDSNYYASIDGIVTYLLVKPEEFQGIFYGNRGQLFMRIETPDQYSINASAFDIQIAKLNAGDRGEVVIEYIDSKKSYPCVISQITPQIQTPSNQQNSRPGMLKEKGTGTYKVSCTFYTGGERLMGGTLAKVIFKYDKIHVGMALPWSAVEIVAGKGHVKIANYKNENKKREVVLGNFDQNYVEIKSGINQGDIVEIML
ncbi:MAG: hypothetical protein HQK53_07930, partial [Oligoflexia bacterium]|nr:hypothetical protein [Oligoflexia bacterium]